MESFVAGAIAAFMLSAFFLTVAFLVVVWGGVLVVSALTRLSVVERRLAVLETRAAAAPVRAGAPATRAVAPPAPASPPVVGPPAEAPMPAAMESTFETGRTQIFTSERLSQYSDAEDTHIGPIDSFVADLPTEDVSSVELPPPEPPEPARPAAAAPAPEPPPAPWTLERVLAWGAAAGGGFFVVLAALFALVVISERGWVGPAVRVSGALTAGVFTWAAGAWLRAGAHRVVGAALSGTGVGLLYGALFAGTSYYELIPRGLGFALLVAVSAVAVIAADRQRDRLLAGLASVGGVLTPVLVSSGENNPLGLFAYLGVLLSGAFLVAHRRGWPDLLLLTSLGASALHFGWTVRWYAPDQVVPALLGAFILGLPAAFVAARAVALPTRIAAASVVALTPLLALPWVVPINPWFSDPISGQRVLREADGAPGAVAAAMLLLPLPGLLAARAQRDPWLAGAMGAILATLVTAVAAGGAVVDAPTVGALTAAVALALLAPILTLGRWPEAGPAPGLALVGAGGAAAVLAGVFDGGDAAMAPALVVAGLGAVLAVWTPGFGTASIAALALGAPLFVLALRLEELGAAAVAAPAVLGWALLATWPLLGKAGGWGRHLGAALAPLVALVPLYLAWEQSPFAEAPGLLPLGLGLVAVLGAGALARGHRAPPDDLALAALVGVALFLISAVFPAQLEDSWLTVSWALEIAALAWVGRRFTHPLLSAVIPVLAIAVAVRLLFNPYALAYGDAGGLPVLNWTLWTWGVPTAALLVGAAGLRRPGEGTRVQVEAALALSLVLLAIATGFALVNVQVSDAFQDAGPIELSVGGLAQGMVRSVSWGVYGIVVLAIGLWRDSRAVRLAGFAVVMLATAKVFAIDLWALSGFARVGSVLGLGLSLLVAAFLFERLVLRSAQKPETP